MALMPCSFNSHRYVGKAAHFYPALLHGNDSTRAHLRLCPDHAATFAATIERYEVPVEDHGFIQDDMALLCPSCNMVCLERDRLFFCTSYYGTSDRRDYYAPLHDACPIPPWLQNALRLGESRRSAG